jgi:Tfp pilus assembly protein PilN
MTRFDYRQSSFERLAGRRRPIAIAPEMRLPLFALGAALLLVAATGLIEAQRLAGVNASAVALAERLAIARRDAARVDAERASVQRLRRLHDAVAASHRDTVIAENTIARIGNALPADTWLTRVASTPGGEWSIAGRSTHVEHVGAMLTTIGAADPAASARLVSINATGARGSMLDFVIDREPK